MTLIGSLGLTAGRARGSAVSRALRPLVTLALCATLAEALLPGKGILAQEESRVFDLTLENMVDLTMSSSFRVRRLNYDVERDQLNLRAQRARLRSSADLQLITPAFRLTSEPRWNSTLQKDQIIREHTRRWEGELSIRQPVILFGWPTNGYLSINNRMYQYTQFEDDGTHETDYYNRYYISYSQPLFQPNELKNSLEQAELELESTQIEFNRDILEIVSGVSEAYHDLLEEHHLRTVRQELVTGLERALAIGRRLALGDSARATEVDQIQVELANARERLRSQESSIRLELAEVKQGLGLTVADSVHFETGFSTRSRSRGYRRGSPIRSRFDSHHAAVRDQSPEPGDRFGTDQEPRCIPPEPQHELWARTAG